MPIDTSSYYPEINKPDGEDSTLNGVHDSLFGNRAKEENKEKLIEEKEEKEEFRSEQENQNNLTWFEKIADFLSNFISWIFVPLMMPVYGILFIFRLSILDVVPAGMQTAVTFVIAGINFFAPMLIIFLLKVLGLVNDVGLNGRNERTIPYLLTAICYGASAWFVASRGAPVWVAMFFCGGVAASLINLVINLKWKISAHSAAIAGLVALLIRLQRDVAVESQLYVWLLITVACAGLLGTARIWLGRHTVWQVLAGYAVGFSSVFFIMFIH